MNCYVMCNRFRMCPLPAPRDEPLWVSIRSDDSDSVIMHVQLEEIRLKVSVVDGHRSATDRSKFYRRLDCS